MTLHKPSFKAGLEAAAHELRCVGQLSMADRESLAHRVLKLKPPKASTKASRWRSEVRKQKGSKREEKRERRSEIRASLVQRARREDGTFRCEACFARYADAALLEMDHFFGRARAETVETCWLLCRTCHHYKTNNSPDARHWLVCFLAHADSNGYRAESDRARARLAGIVASRERSANHG